MFNKTKMSLIESLKWRYATKKMDANKKISPSELLIIKEAVQLAASSYGLQPYKVIEIEDSELREKLQPLCWNQSQVTEASHLLLFCNYLEVKAEHIEAFMELKAKVQEVEGNTLTAYGDFVKNKLKEKSKDWQQNWTAKQTYIALANAMIACAELQIDSTPMEGFEADKVNDLLNLHADNLNAAVFLAIGHRSKEDSNQHRKKVRKPLEDLFEKR